MGFYATDTLEPAPPAITGTRRARCETACGRKPLRGPIHNAISGYRSYNPELGRWVNRDPIGERGGYNLYVFVGNGAVFLLDINGLQQYRQYRPGSVGEILWHEGRVPSTPFDFKPYHVDVLDDSFLDATMPTGTPSSGTITSSKYRDCVLACLEYFGISREKIGKKLSYKAIVYAYEHYGPVKTAGAAAKVGKALWVLTAWTGGNIIGCHCVCLFNPDAYPL